MPRLHKESARIQPKLRGLSVFLFTLSLLINTSLVGLAISAHQSSAAPGPNAPFDYILTIVMEDKAYSDIIGNSSAPYLNQLASTYGLATNYHTVSQYGSLPEYLGLVSGNTYDSSWSRCNSPPSTCAGWPAGGVTDLTIIDRIESVGLTWKAYMEDMPSNCYASNSGRYAVIHDPFVYFSHIVNNPSECAKVVPAGTGDSALLSDLASTSTASNYMWLTPNGCNDMHDCPVSTGDTYLSNLVPQILNSNIFKTQKAALLVTWDEDDKTSHITAIWAGPTAKLHYSSGVYYTHYSILRTIESSWSLASLTSNDAAAPAMTEFFSTSTTLQASFTYSPGNPYAGQAITFSGSASGGASPYSFTWNFGDGTFASGNPVTHNYPSQGSYTVSLTVKDSEGSTSKASQVVAVSGPPDFSVSLNPSLLTISTGGSGSSTLTIQGLNGFFGTVTLGASFTPSGPTASLSTSTVNVSPGGAATATVNIKTDNTVSPGNYTATMTGTSSNLAHNATLFLTLKPAPDFAITLYPSQLSIMQGSSVNSGITLTSLNDFSGPVSLSATVSAGGYGVQINPNNPTVPSGGNASSTLTITAPNNTVPNNYVVTLTGKSGSITNTVTIPLTVTSFALSIDPGSLTFRPGSSGTLSIILNSLNGFAGNVTLSARSNNQLHLTLQSGLVHLRSQETVSTTLTISSSVQNNNNVVVTALAGRLSRSLTIQIFVATNPDFYLSASPIFLSLLQGSSASSAVTVTSVNGLSAKVQFSLGANPGGPQVSISPTSVQIVSGGSATATLTLSIPASLAIGVYSVTVTGTAGPKHPVILTLFVTRPMPDFSLNYDPSSQSVVAGNPANYTIGLTSLDGFSGNIDLTATSQSSLSPTINPPSVTLNAGGSATVKLTATTTSATPPATYTIIITATGGTTSHSVSVTLAVTASPDFALTANPTAQTTLAGLPANTTISLNSANGFSGTVNLSVSISPSSGLSCALNPASINGSQTSTLSCNGQAGAYVATITGTSGSLNRSINVTFTVQDFAISASPSTVSFSAGGSGNSTITIGSLQGFNGNVQLSASTSSTFITASLNPASIIGSGNSTLSVSGSVPGSYTVNVTGTSGSLSHSIVAHVSVNPTQDFTISASPSSVTDYANSAGASSITVSGVNGFTGTVTISQNGGPDCSLSSSSIPLTPVSPTGSADLSCTFTFAGKYNVTATGKSGTVSHSTTVYFTVQDFAIAAIPASVTVASGNAGTSTIVVTEQQGFSGTVSLATPSSSCSLSNASVTGSENSTLSCTFSSAGNYSVNVTGTSNSLSHSVSVTYTVTTAPSFTVSANPTSGTILAGTTGTSTISVLGQNGFSGTVTLSETASPSTGLTCNLSPTSLPVSSRANGTSTLSCSGSAGSYTVTVTGTSPGAPSQYTTVTIAVQDFSITANPSNIGFTAGGTGSSTININPLQGFSGTVNLSAIVSSPNISASLSPASLTGSGMSTLTISSSTTGSYSVTIVGQSGSLSHNVTIAVNVGGTQDFQLSVNPTSITVYAGGSNSSLVGVTSTNGFAGDVSLSATSPSGISTTFSNNPVAAGGTSTLTVSATTGLAAGIYNINITGTSGSLTHSVNLSVRVLVRPAIAFVTAVPVAYSSSNTITTSPLSFVKGNLIVVYVTVGAGQTVTSVTDSGNPTSSYTQRASPSNGNSILYVYTAWAATGTSNTITIVMSATGYLAASAAEYSGATGFGASTTSTGNSATPSVTLTTQSASSWVLVSYAWIGTATHASDSGFADRHAGSSGTQHLDYGDTNGPKAVGTYTFSGSLTTTDPWVMIAIEIV